MNNRAYSSFISLLLLIGLKSFAQNPGINGQWSEPIPFQIVPVALANLPDGRLLTWSSKYHDDFGGNDGFTFTQIFDPSIGQDGRVLPSTRTDTNHDMFCPGINNLPDGRILATGGSSSQRSSIYDPNTETWIRAENLNIGRGYQGAVTLANGSALTIGGSWSGGAYGGRAAEVWTKGSGWRVLKGLPGELLWNTNDRNREPAGTYRLDNHAWLFAAPNGKVFHAGPGETMHWIDVSGNGSSREMGRRSDDRSSMNGNAVMFDIGKILKVGGTGSYDGGSTGSTKGYVISINNGDVVSVSPTSNDMQHARIYVSSVVLPTGEVLILGGMKTSKVFSDAGAYLSAELYSPDTNSFRTLASMQVPRTYHSAAILLNDGRVFMGGGGLCGDHCPPGGANHPDAEIYSPPYLFDANGQLAVRPMLNAPLEAFYGRSLAVQSTPAIAEFAFVRMSSATHSVNNEQRRIPVGFTGSNGNYQLDMPNANLMPPGYYMLFAINSAGVPSISKAVLVGPPDSIVNPDNLLVEFEFSEGSGSLIMDTSGKNNNAQIKQRDNNGNAVALSSDYWNELGVPGSSLQMDGLEHTSNSIVEIPSSASLASLKNKITVMAWVNRKVGSVIPQNGKIPNVAIFAHDYSSFFFGYHNSMYKLEFYTKSGGRASCYTGTYTPGEWEHIVGTYDGITAILYVNGREICNKTVTGDLRINTQDPLYSTFTLSGFYDKRAAPVVSYGNKSGITDELDGSLDKFKLYNVALTQQEVLSIYNQELELIDPIIEDNTCENLAIVYEINGQRGSATTEISVIEGDDVGLFLNLNSVDYTVTNPDGAVLGSPILNNITSAQAGVYSIRPSNVAGGEEVAPKLIFVDSQETVDETAPALYALDGNPNTFWHTEWSTKGGANPGYPHELQLDMGPNSILTGFTYLPRQNNENGRIGDFDVYVSNSTSNWGNRIANGTGGNNKDLVTVSFPETSARYVRFVARKPAVSGQAWASAAEIKVIRAADAKCVKTIRINVTPAITYIYNGTWSPRDPSGIATSNNNIRIVSGETVISKNTFCNDLIVEPGAALTVDQGVKITANTITLKSTSQVYSSLILNGEIDRAINYERYVNKVGTSTGGGNDLISAPVENQLFGSFASANQGHLAAMENTLAFAPYITTAGFYQNYNIPTNASTIINSGVGYRVATTHGSTLIFTGRTSKTNVNVPISNASKGKAWNLIGNPYPSYIDFHTFFNANIDSFNGGEAFQAIYGYNGVHQINGRF